MKFENKLNLDLKAFFVCLFFISTIFTPNIAKGEEREQPNILWVICDQLNWNYLSAEGNAYLSTPNLDSLYNSGLHFDKAYTINPTCIPQRIGMFTGQRPTKMGIHIPKPGIDAQRTDMVQYAQEQQIASRFQDAGYKTYYGGKTHFGVSGYEFTPIDMGFEVYATDKEYRGIDCVPQAIQTLNNHAENHSDQPFFMVTSLMNPHDICYTHIKENKYDTAAISERLSSDVEWVQKLKASVLNTLKIPEGEIGAGNYEPVDYYLNNAPPLPTNYKPQSDEPSYVSGINEDYEGMASAFGRFRADYDSIDWLLHRYAYNRFVEQIDNEVGALLQGLAAAGLNENTYIIFTSDHGEQNASHQMAGKGIMFEESVHVPLIVTHPNITQKRTDSVNLVNTGLDLLPTMFDLASISPPEDYEGVSLKPIIENPTYQIKREVIPIEFSSGMGVITKDFFYNIYYNGDYHNEQLIDINKSPMQMTNEVSNPDYNEVLHALRDSFVSVNGETLKFYNYPEHFTKFLNIDLSNNIDPDRPANDVKRFQDQMMGMQANMNLEQFIDVETSDKCFYNASAPYAIENSKEIDFGFYRSGSNGLCIASPSESTSAQYIYNDNKGPNQWQFRNETLFVLSDTLIFGKSNFQTITKDKQLYEEFEKSTQGNTLKGMKPDDIVIFKTKDSNYGALLLTSFINSTTGSVGFDYIIGNSVISSLNDKSGNHINIYPNPFYDYLTVDNLPHNTQLNISDINGKLIYNNILIDSENQLNLKSLAKGLYILTAANNTSIYSRRVIKL